ncbi:MAG: right-handed parallel beta-helix repeat-containing protein, partial [Thermodesulfobacteriota bacterium]|nr:right-handed parallel beta-helix repeat-containing protein [Thermodesulfobacteriota bacterium]
MTGDEEIQNQSIVLNGNLIVKKGGRLTMREVDLEIASPGDRHYGISVEPEGSLSIHNSRIFSDSKCGFTFVAGSSFKDHKPGSAGLVIKGSQLRGVNGLELNAIDYADIEDNTFMVNVPDDRINCLDLNGARNCTIKNNKIEAYPPVSAGSRSPLIGIAARRSHYNTITGNHISDTRNGFNMAFSWNNHLADNTWIGPIGKSDIKTLTTRWWSVGTTDDAAEAGLYLGPWSNNNIVENNTFLLSNTGIIVVEQSGSNQITRNTAKGGGIGIALLWASDNIIDGNDFSDIFREEAIHAFAARNNLIINNSVSSSAGGIGLFSSNKNTLKGNKISASGRGIFLHESSNNSIENNEVSATAMPIVLSASSDNAIQKNNLAQDELQRYDDGDNNIWGENYWGDEVVTPYPVPPNGMDYNPANASIPVLPVQAPGLNPMEFKDIPYREWVINDEVVWENQSVTLTEGLCVKEGGSLTLRNVTLNFVPEDATESFEQGPNPFSITVDSGGSLFIYDSKIVGPEWGPLSGLQITAFNDSNFTIKNSEIHNAGLWGGDGAVAIEGASGAIIENNRFYRTYCAISVEDASDVRVINNTILNGVFGINVIGGENHTIAGNSISRTAWKGIWIEAPNIPVSDNEISNAWGVGIFPYHWGMMPENNSFSNIRGPNLLFQDPMILTGPQGLRAFSYDSANVEPGENVTVFVSLAHTSPFFGLPGFPKTIYDVLTISFNVHLRVNGQILDTKRATVGLGDTTMVKLTGTAPATGIYDVKIDPMPVANGDVAPLGKRDGKIGVGDALIALRFALGLETPTQDDTHHGDVAPLDAQGQPSPDGMINVGDALVI